MFKFFKKQQKKSSERPKSWYDTPSEQVKETGIIPILRSKAQIDRELKYIPNMYVEKLSKNFYTVYGNITFHEHTARISTSNVAVNETKRKQAINNAEKNFSRFYEGGVASPVGYTEKKGKYNDVIVWSNFRGSNVTPMLFAPSHLFAYTEKVLKNNVKTKIPPVNKLNVILVNEEHIIVGFTNMKVPFRKQINLKRENENSAYGLQELIISRTGKITFL